jgi:hypothetical protein
LNHQIIKALSYPSKPKTSGNVMISQTLEKESPHIETKISKKA